jgi:histidinol-phosphate/aromatic aminotransferase/cobyric acid decarboxylase-like protein
MTTNQNNANLIITIAAEEDRQYVYKMRHSIYAEELRQHPVNDLKQLQDDLDKDNVYIVAKNQNEIVGFISITLPSAPRYSVDKYFDRALIPYDFNNDLYEVRILSVDKNYRSSYLALLLMYASYRWIQSRGGKYIVAICRFDILNMYCKAGLRPLGPTAKSGAVTYALATATIEQLNKWANEKAALLKALNSKISWQLNCAYFTTSSCYHGGAFFKAIGEDLQTLDNRKDVINADVLDAWFPPSPKVMDGLRAHMSWLLQTSPPTHCDGLIDAIAKVRKVDRDSILPGAGSSDLIFLALRYFLNFNSKVLILDPCYGEYAHVLENVIGCKVTRFTLQRSQGFIVDTEALLAELKNGYDMVIIVNPNSPTGAYVPKEEMETFLLQVSKTTLVWVDETYIEYVGSIHSLERFAADVTNVIICKSMSKVYALSGARVGYLCSSPHIIQTLKEITPPWAVSLPAQLAAITALQDEEYYSHKHHQTHQLRKKLQKDLIDLGMEEVIDGCANFLLFYLPKNFPSAKAFVETCKSHNLFLRDVSNMGKTLGCKAVRMAVKDEETNEKMINIIKQVIAKNYNDKAGANHFASVHRRATAES